MGLVSDAGAAASAHVAFVVLQPASWGRFKGLNARKDVADTLTAMVSHTLWVVMMGEHIEAAHPLGARSGSPLRLISFDFGLRSQGIKAIRLGGSFCSVTKHNGAYYQVSRRTQPINAGLVLPPPLSGKGGRVRCGIAPASAPSGTATEGTPTT